MNSLNLPRAALPVTVQDMHGYPVTEKFSQKFGGKLSNALLKELGAVFKTSNGCSRPVVDGAEKAICEFCLFLTQITAGKSLLSLNELSPILFKNYIDHLMRKFPTKHTNGKTTHPWWRKWGNLRARLANTIAKEMFPYIAKQSSNKTEGHTPYAMGMILEALRREIDRIRGKLYFANDGTVDLKWFVLAKRGRVLNRDQLKAFVPINTSSLTSEQIDLLGRAIFEPDWRSHNQLAKDFNLSASRLYVIKRWWRSRGRLKGRPKEKVTCDLTIEDVIATLDYYLPDWPVTGSMHLKGTNYRVYRSSAGILQGVYKEEQEAIAVADEIGGVIVTTNRGKIKINDGFNPAELLLIYFRQSEGKNGTSNALSQKLKKILPNGIRSLLAEYFPTTYDWTIILLYWLVMTGWNCEAIRSVNRLEVLRQICKGGSNELLSKEHVTFKVVIDDINEDDVAELVGEKVRGQPEGRPKIYTHISDRCEPYGLFRVVEDYYRLTAPFIKYLAGEDVNRLLFGFSQANQTTFTILARHLHLELGTLRQKLAEFFKRNIIFEDSDQTQRITQSTPRELRVTYFTALRSLNVPITMLAFLAGHESIDTHLVHYSSGQHGTRILREKSRKLLNVVADKAFFGTLTRYTQTPKKGRSRTVRAFTPDIVN
jgi:hypothetical protein